MHKVGKEQERIHTPHTLTRRTFFKRTLEVGLSTLLTNFLLDSCGSDSNKTPPLRPERVNPIGIVSHLNYAQGSEIESQLQLLEQAGARWTRFDFEWREVQPTPGAFDFTTHGFDTIIDSAQKKGIGVQALLNLNAAPIWKVGDGEAAYKKLIDTPEDYAQYVKQVATHYRGKIKLYEIGNEEDLAMDVSTYTRYLKAAYRAIKEADPHAKVVTGGITFGDSPNYPISWLNGLYANGAQGYFDYFGYHPYSEPDGPDSIRFGVMKKLNALLQHYGKNNGIIVSEEGWTTANNRQGVTPEIQAAYIKQVYDKIFSEFPFIAIAFIYELLNEGKDHSTNSQDDYGIYHEDKSPKPAVQVIKNARRNFDKNYTEINP